MQKIELLKKNIAHLQSRLFGEEIGEKVLDFLIPFLTESENINHDRKLNDKRLESKSSRALTKNKFTFESLLVEKEPEYVKFDSNDAFDCGFFQIKYEHFDVLFYSIFFGDAIKIFKIEKDTLITDENIKLSTQHKGAEILLQFHIKRDTLNHHLENYLYNSITWEDFLNYVEKEIEEIK